MNHALSVSALLADPVAYDGMDVSVVGFFIYFKEDVALYPNDSRNRSPAEAIRLVHPATVHGERRTKSLTRKWVRIEGTFYSRRRSRPDCFPGEISNIQVIEASDPPSDLISEQTVE